MVATEYSLLLAQLERLTGGEVEGGAGNVTLQASEKKIIQKDK